MNIPRSEANIAQLRKTDLPIVSSKNKLDDKTWFDLIMLAGPINNKENGIKQSFHHSLGYPSIPYLLGNLNLTGNLRMVTVTRLPDEKGIEIILAIEGAKPGVLNGEAPMSKASILITPKGEIQKFESSMWGEDKELIQNGKVKEAVSDIVRSLSLELTAAKESDTNANDRFIMKSALSGVGLVLGNLPGLAIASVWNLWDELVFHAPGQKHYWENNAKNKDRWDPL